MNEQEKIYRLIAADTLGEEMTEEERAALTQWLDADPRHRDIYNKVKAGDTARSILALDSEGYGERMAALWRENTERRFSTCVTGASGFQPEATQIETTANCAEQHTAAQVENLRTQLRRLETCAPHSRNRLFARFGRTVVRPYIAVAASIALLVGLFFTYQTFTPEQQTVAEVITPGHTGAVLTLSDGQRIALTAGSRASVAALIDSVGVSTETADGFCTLRVERGEEYTVTLADGSTVTLNSETELRFPSRFTQAERRVTLTGEALFAVAKDRAHPFIVSTATGSIRVYGTRFTVTARHGEPLRATLVEGSIGFTSPEGHETRLRPGEQLTYDSREQTMEVAPVDPEPATAFADDLFIFDDQPLEEIMATLSRWYSCDVTFVDNASREVRLSGRLRRHDDIRTLLESYEQTTGLHFRINGRRITVTK